MLLNKLTSTMCGKFPNRSIGVESATMPENDKFKDYTRYAEHCLNMVAATTDQELRRIQREMAAEWLRLADAVRPHESE
jgi:hypothetical protein